MEVDGAGPSSAKATKRGTWQKIVNALGEEEKQEEAEESRKKFLQWRNECRKAQRKHQNDLVQKLDAALPKSALRQVRIKQGAGARALGTGGRSMHQALENVVEYISEGIARRRQLTSKARGCISRGKHSEISPGCSNECEKRVCARSAERQRLDYSRRRAGRRRLLLRSAMGGHERPKSRKLCPV